MESFNRTANGQLLMQPSYGNANTSLTPEYRYGSPRKVYFDGLGVDIDGAVVSGITSNNESAATLIQQYGTQLSALEHRTLEILFTDETNPGDATSTVKALTKAVTQGQTLYALDQNNIHDLDQITTTQAIKDDIRNGVNAGLIATIHEQPVTIGGWTGTGYSLVDPITGAGAYRIGGGENGGACDLQCAEVSASILISGVDSGALPRLYSAFKSLSSTYSAALKVENILKNCPAQLIATAGGFLLLSASLSALKNELRTGKLSGKPLSYLSISLTLMLALDYIFKIVVSECSG